MLREDCTPTKKKRKFEFGVSKSRTRSKLIICCIAELVGSIGIVCITCGSVVEAPDFYVFHTLYCYIAFCYGFTTMMIILIFGHISGGIANPSLTIACFFCGMLHIYEVILYIISQLIGAAIGTALVHSYVPREIRGKSPEVCSPWIPKNSNMIRCAFAEFFGTFIFLLVCCAMWDYRNRKWQETTSIKIGITICALVLALSGYSNAHFNPARSFGPALVNLEFKYLWIYILPQLAAAIVGPIIYKFLFDGKDFDRANVGNFDNSVDDL